MNNETITEHQFLKLKVLCDYLLFDQFSERISYPRFEECVNLLAKSQKFNLKKVFIELCGRRNKYITFQRLLSAYQDCISKESSADLQTFFSYFLDSVIKTCSEIAGVDVSHCKNFSTKSHKNRNFINKIELYSDKSNNIKGINIEYDNFFSNDIFEDEKAKKTLKKKICLNLKKIDDFEEESIEENTMRDFVTHIYGTYTSHIEFLGFKTRAGKMSYTGDLKIGKPFLFGQFHHKFHYINLGISNEGINYLQPFFIPSLYCNFNIQIDFEEYKENNFTLHKIEQYEDEKVLENIEDEDEYLTHVITPFYQDDRFYKQDKDDIMDRKLKELFSFENQFTIDLNELDTGNKTMGIFSSKEKLNKENNYDNEQNNEYYNKYEAMIKSEGGLGPDNNFDEEDEDEEEFMIPEENEEIKLFEREMDNVEKLKQLKLHRLPYLNRWNGISVKKLDFSSIFSDPFSLEKFIDLFYTEIQYEIETRLIKLNELTNPANFYSKYLLHDKCYMHQYESEFFEEDYSRHLQEMKSEFEKISKNLTESNTEDISQEQCITEGSITDLNINMSITHRHNNAKTLDRKWKRFGNHGKKILIFGAFKMASAVNCARKILLNCEDNFMDKSHSLVDKINALKILYGIRPKSITEKSTKQEVMEFLKNGVLSEVKRVISVRNQERNNKEIQAKREKEENKKKEKLRIETNKKDKQMEEEKNINMEKDINDDKINKADDQLKKPESNILRNNVLIFQHIVERHVIIDHLKLVDKKLEKIETIMKEAASNDKQEKKSLIEQYDNLKKNKINSVKYLIELNKNKISEKLNVDSEELIRQETKKRKEIICLQKELVQKKQTINNTLKKEKLNDPVTFSDIEIPCDTKIYRGQQIIKGKEFADDIFPAKIESLCPINPKTKSWILPLEVEEEDILNWERFQWERIDIIFRSPDYQIFVNKIEPADIIQGSLGDCYFLSALASLAKFPELIEKLFLFKEKSLDRCYGIYLRKNGIWKLILLDDYVPCYGDSRKMFAFSSANEKEMWVVLLEKAWAKICGSYAKVIAGQSNEVFDATTNAPTEILSVSQLSKEDIWSKLNEGRNKDFIMTAGTGDMVSMAEYNKVNLQSGHAYTILNILEVTVDGKITRLIKIRNPWGVGEWSGDWSDKSKLWNSDLAKQVNLENKDNGEFYMSFDDLVKYFNVINICRLHKNYLYSYVHYKKTEVSKPNLMSLDVEKESEVYLQIHQKNPRFGSKSGKNADRILMHIMIVDEKMNFIAAACDDTSSIFLTLNLQPGKYYVYTDINHRYVNVANILGYNVTTYSSNIVTLSKELNQDPLKICENGIISYAKSNLNLKRRDDLEFYSPENIIQEFPFIFVVIENAGSTTTEVILDLKNNKESSIFPDENLRSKSLTKKIEKNQIEVFFIIRHKLDSSLEYNWNTRKINK